ncbi:hypothetical protein [Streptomyces sp. NPDC048269]
MKSIVQSWIQPAPSSTEKNCSQLGDSPTPVPDHTTLAAMTSRYADRG